MSNISAGTSTTTSLVQTGDLTGNLVLQSNAVSIATITSTGVLVTGVVSSTGNVTGNYFVGNGSALTSITAASATTAATVTTAAQPNITSVGTLTSVTSSGFISQTQSSNVMSRISLVNTVRNWSISNYGNQFSPNGSFNIADETGGTVRLQITTGGIVAISGSLTVSTGNITGGNIVNANANGVGNIGSSTTYFNTVFAKATSAQYADLAEIYTADNIYESGTVVIFGGDEEITVTTEMADERVAGAISTNPAYLMNTGQTGLPVALRGRVPVNVIGPVEKGDSLVTANVAGYAVSVGRDHRYGQSVFAKALETNKDTGTKVITAVIL